MATPTLNFPRRSANGVPPRINKTGTDDAALETLQIDETKVFIHDARTLPAASTPMNNAAADTVAGPPAAAEARITLRPVRGGDIPISRAAAEACDIWREGDGEVVHIALDFEPALLRCAAEGIEELHRRRNEAEEARRRACAAALDESTLPELTEVVAFFGHEELLIVLQEKMAAVFEGLGTPGAIRAHFRIAPDLSAEEEAAAATAPLLSTPGAPALTTPPAAPAVSRSLSTRVRTADAAEACLGRCGGATLRTMVGVSRAWAHRARVTAARADWLEATTLMGGEGEERTAEIGWALAHAEDLQELLRRLPAVARLRAGGEHAELVPLLGAQVMDRLDRPFGRPLREAVALYVVMKSNALTTIGEGAFEGCTSLASLTLPDSLTTIGRGAFAGCTVASLALPDSLTTIGEYAFEGCTSLASLTLAAGLTTIGEYAFYGCTSLASLTLPDSITAISRGAFEGCSSLASLTLPDSLTTIDHGAFEDCTSLASLTLPDSLTTIGEGAFLGCTSLASLTLPASLTTIGESAFVDCTSLASLTLPDSLTTIGESAFHGCTSLASLTLPASLTTIGEGAFDGCTSLASLTLPDSFTTIGDLASFVDCSSLASLTLPDSITAISEYAFYGCTSLASLTLPASLTTIGEGAFEDCASLTSLTLPDSITTIGGLAFRGCTSLASLTLPDSLTTIGESAFEDCASLTSLTLPDSLTTIGEYAFEGCTSLAFLTLPASLTTIGERTFVGCASFTTLTIISNHTESLVLTRSQPFDTEAVLREVARPVYPNDATGHAEGPAEVTTLD